MSFLQDPVFVTSPPASVEYVVFQNLSGVGGLNLLHQFLDFFLLGGRKFAQLNYRNRDNDDDID